MKYRLNLAAQPFSPRRATNMLLTFMLLLTMVFSAWQVLEYRRYQAGSPDLVALEELESTAGDMSRQIEELNGRLSQPGAQAQLRELRYLSEVLERKQFSWTRMLQVVESVIPRTVYLVGLQPEIDEDGSIYIHMEARGQTIEALSQFVADLENTPAFAEVTVSLDERGTVEGRSEVRMVMGANYTQDAEVVDAALVVERP